MPLPSSGEISLNDIHTEIARSAANNTEASISDDLILTLGDIPTPIMVNSQQNLSFSDWYSKGIDISIATLNGVNTITEGNAIALIAKGNVGTYYYDINHITTSNSDFSNASSLSGSFTIPTQQAGSGGSIIGVGSTVDEGVAGEGNETCEFRLRYGASGAAIEDSVTITLQDPPAAGFTLATDKSTIDEYGHVYGDTATLTATGTNVPNGTVYYLHINHGTTAAADFNETFPIAITMNNNSGTATVSVVGDTTGEGAQGCTFDLRSGTSSSSTLLAGGVAVTVIDYAIVGHLSSSIDETGSLNFAGSGPSDGSALWWEVVHGTTTAADFSGATSGTVTPGTNGIFQPNQGNSFTLNGAADGTTEGSETFTVRLKPSIGSSTILATSPTLTMNDTSTQTYSITPVANNVDEGTSLDFNIVGAPSTTHYWTRNNITTNNGDFTSGSFGARTLDATGTQTATLVYTRADSLTEGSETFSVDLRTGGYSGTIVASSGTITINDTSQAPVVVTEDPYYEMHLLRTITGQASYWASTTDSLASYAGQKGRLVFAYQNGTSGTSYRGDMQFDAVSFDGNSYSFENSGEDWITSTTMGSGQSAGLDPNNLRTFEDKIGNYANIGVSTTSYRWNSDSGGTSSSSTALSSAASGSYYIYAETSGSNTSGSNFTAASPLVQLSNSPGNAAYQFARYGNNIGTTRVYWAENKTTDPYPAPQTATIYGPWLSTQNSSVDWVSSSSNSVTTAYGQWGSVTDGSTCRLVIAYRSGNGFRGDLQLDDWWANVSSTSTSGGTPLQIDSTQTQKSDILTTYNSSTFPNASQIESIYNTSNFTGVGYGTSSGTWNLDSAGTPSGSTGLSNVGSGYYCYFEASFSGYSYKMRLLRSKPFTAVANKGFTGKIGHYGSNMGTLRVFIAEE